MKRSNTGYRILLVFVGALLFVPLAAPAQENALRLHDRARTALDANDVFRAIELFSLSLAANPAYVPSLIGIAESFYRLDEYDEAYRYVTDARRYTRNNAAVLNLQGRILIGLGRPDEAGRVLAEVLRFEPNNIDARIGTAELALAEGRSSDALSAYREVVRFAPHNRKALLSLSLVHDSLGDRDAAERYLLLAVQYHREDPTVRVLAGEYYASRALYAEAERHARTAIALDDARTDAYLLLAEIVYRRGSLSEAVAVVETVIAREPDSYRAWYTKGVLHSEAGDAEAAIESFDRALRIRNDAEIARIALEAVVLAEWELEDPRREQYAAYHFNRADVFYRDNLFARAAAEYRRGLVLNPYDRNGRIRFAELSMSRGYIAEYVDQLRVLESLGHDDQFIRDRIEAFERIAADAPAARWGVDQFLVERDRTPVSVFTIPSENPLEHVDGSRFLVSYFRDVLLGSERVEVLGRAESVDTTSEAFARARAAGAAYFIMVRFSEFDRSFSVVADLHHARTGARIARYSSSRSGNDRVINATSRVAETLTAEMPVKGRLLARELDRGIANVGSMDGIEPDAIGAIVRSGTVSYRTDAPGLTYGQGDLVGEFRITELDDLVAHGTIRRAAFFDLINVGDTIILPAKAENVVREEPVFRPPVFRRVSAVR